MKRTQLKSFVRNIVKEAILKEMAGDNVDAAAATTRLTPNQRQVVSALMQRKFKPVKYTDAGNNRVNIVLELPYGIEVAGGNRWANVAPNGRINRDQLDVRTFLKGVMGEGQPVGGVKNDHEFDDGREAVMKAVNVEEASKKEGDTVQVADGSGVDSGKIGVIVPTEFKQTAGGLIPNEPGAYKPLPKGWLSVKFEDGHVASFPASRLQLPFPFLKDKALKEEDRKCDCGSGLPSEWALDGQGIPLVRVCDRCRKEKLSHYRPEILKHYTQADVDEPIEPDEQDEQTSSGAAGAYSSPFAFKKKKVREKIGPDGRYVDDMESALQLKSISGLSESVPMYDKDTHVHRQPCPCGSGLPSYVKLDARGKPLARVCKKCDDKGRKGKPVTLKDLRSTKRRGRNIGEIAGFGAALVSAAGGLAVYKILRSLIDNLATDKQWRRKKLTVAVIDSIFKAVKMRHPELKDEELYYFKQEVLSALDANKITTIEDLQQYLNSKKLEEVNIRNTIETGIFMTATLASMIYNALGNLFRTSLKSRWKNLPVTEANIDRLLGMIKIKNPSIKDDDIKRARADLIKVISDRSVGTMPELMKYLKSYFDYTLDEANKRGLDYQIIKRVKNASYKFFKANVENIQIAYKNGPDDIVFEVYLGPDWVRKFVRFHGVNRPFEVWDESKERFVPTNMFVRNFQEDTNIQEMTGTGAVAGYATPFAFTKNKDGSKRALDVTKKLGFKVAKSISEEENILK
jgi:hypothetical protein